MRLNHNMMSLSAFSTYKKNVASNSSALERLSSGVKINSAKDNPNKIAQSEQMRIQIKCLETANKNIQDASSMVQTAEGALQEVNSILSRMKELAVSAADGTKAESDIAAIQEEYNQLSKGINDLAKNTEFNGVKLLGDDRVKNNNYPIHTKTIVGAMVGEDVSIPIFNLNTDVLKDKDGNSLSSVEFSNSEKASKAISTIDDVITSVSSMRSKYGSLASRFETTAANVDSNIYITEGAESSIRDADVAVEIMEVTRTNILTQASIGLIAQSNNFPKDSLRILQNSIR